VRGTNEASLLAHREVLPNPTTGVGESVGRGEARSPTSSLPPRIVTAAGGSSLLERCLRTKPLPPDLELLERHPEHLLVTPLELAQPVHQGEEEVELVACGHARKRRSESECRLSTLARPRVGRGRGRQ